MSDNPAAPERSITECDVVVVGAGISGLATADALLGGTPSAPRTPSTPGASVVVLEATERVGGRLLSFADGDHRYDLGASWIWPNEPLVTALVDRLGVATFEAHLDGVAMYEDNQAVHRLDHNPLDSPSSRFVDGADALAVALAATLPAGAIKFDTPATRIEATDSGFLVSTPNGQFRAADVVVALPPALAAATIQFAPGLPDDIAALAATTPVWMGSTTKVVAVYETPFWRSDGLAGSAMSHVGPLREIHDLSPPQGAGALFGFAQAGVPIEPAAVCDQFGRLFGVAAASPQRIEMTDWSTVPSASPPNALALTNYRTYGHPRFSQPGTEGRLHWVGTETSPAFPGHIEGALHSARSAADAIQKQAR